MKKLRVGIVYGGRSGEHEISVTSAGSIFKHIDRQRYEPVAIRIEKDGRWTLPDQPPQALTAAEVINEAKTRLRADGSARSAEKDLGGGEPAMLGALNLDVVFPVLHGPYGEDGTIQGLLELANMAYVGAGVLASAAGMDKAAMKMLFAARALPVGVWRTFVRADWERDRASVLKDLEPLGYPMFVKPANLGSSVGISKVKARADLVPAIDMALDYDRKVVVEAAVPNAREIECSVLGNDDPQASRPGEIIPSREFYDYEAKYIDDDSKTVIPAELPADVVKKIQQLSIGAFRAVDCSGLARVDFLLSRDTGEIVLNEINTMPGFTSISMYSKMWEASGVSYADLVHRLIQLGLERHAQKQKLKTSFV
ncbi:MAG TPA: D-alanine--D-alanine ligase family protein [Vicinamibacterales bacterium]|nr:D-alanine--D-alanine ligase family protein [Vicinamibacterales bacterium]